MADVKQIYSIVNSIASQALGRSVVVDTDTSFVNLGTEILSSDKNVDAWFNALVDRIGRTVMAMREYKANNAELKRDPIEFGVVLQKLSVQMPDAKKNTTWNKQSEAASNPFDKSAMTIKQKLFTDFSTWEVDGTIPDMQLQTAFTSASAMAALIDAIFTAMYNSLELAYQNTANLCRANFMALRKNKGYNLLNMYNTETNHSLTVASALIDPDFLRYSSMMINLVSNRMAVLSRTFNDGSIDRFTSRDMQIINILADFNSRFTSYLQADTFHKELVALPNFKAVPYWQGSGTNWSFADVSSIKVQPANAELPIQMANVVACIYDRDAMGVTIDKRRTKSIYNPKDEYTNYFMKAEMGFYNDLSENGVVFYLEEV